MYSILQFVCLYVGNISYVVTCDVLREFKECHYSWNGVVDIKRMSWLLEWAHIYYLCTLLGWGILNIWLCGWDFIWFWLYSVLQFIYIFIFLLGWKSLILKYILYSSEVYLIKRYNFDFWLHNMRPWNSYMIKLERYCVYNIWVDLFMIVLIFWL